MTEKIAEAHESVSPVCYTCAAHILTNEGHFHDLSKLTGDLRSGRKRPLMCPIPSSLDTDAGQDSPESVLKRQLKR